ncbi:sporulation protein [Metabacillus litoralis]|jgi:sporulation-control protein|uniref:sporulation protein n=1 Tax=Metabacillus litoralis TaxID=152268 RepID=UPI00203E919F|nr:sporulation protein [Metabacillus litoralis]MCM3651654.1 sporulation protein [Metabacillus litoralis]
MILRKYMSLLGVGSANIDLILPKESYQRGEVINGYFTITGGTIEQQLKRIDCDLVMQDHATRQKEVIDTTTILSSKLIQSDECNHISFSFMLPEKLSASSEEISYHFRTRMTFNEGVESKDLDIIHVV